MVWHCLNDLNLVQFKPYLLLTSINTSYFEHNWWLAFFLLTTVKILSFYPSHHMAEWFFLRTTVIFYNFSTWLIIFGKVFGFQISYLLEIIFIKNMKHITPVEVQNLRSWAGACIIINYWNNNTCATKWFFFSSFKYKWLGEGGLHKYSMGAWGFRTSVYTSIGGRTQPIELFPTLAMMLLFYMLIYLVQYEPHLFN